MWQLAAHLCKQRGWSSASSRGIQGVISDQLVCCRLSHLHILLFQESYPTSDLPGLLRAAVYHRQKKISECEEVIFLHINWCLNVWMFELYMHRCCKHTNLMRLSWLWHRCVWSRVVHLKQHKVCGMWLLCSMLLLLLQHLWLCIRVLGMIRLR